MVSSKPSSLELYVLNQNYGVIKMKNKQKIRGIAVGAVVAALYVVLTYLANTLGLASGVIQVRLSEILCVMPVFTPYAIPGLFIGCVLANILTGCALWSLRVLNPSHVVVKVMHLFFCLSTCAPVVMLYKTGVFSNVQSLIA